MFLNKVFQMFEVCKNRSWLYGFALWEWAPKLPSKSEACKDEDSAYGNFKDALIAGNLDYMNQFMNQVALQIFSSFDTGNKPSEEQEPERFYHGFVLGLIVDLAEKYRITSNRESESGIMDSHSEGRKS